MNHINIEMEAVGIGLEQVVAVLNVFDERVSDELAAACRATSDPYAHHFADRYETLRSLLLLSLDSIGGIIEKCNPGSGQAQDTAAESEGENTLKGKLLRLIDGMDQEKLRLIYVVALEFSSTGKE